MRSLSRLFCGCKGQITPPQVRVKARLWAACRQWTRAGARAERQGKNELGRGIETEQAPEHSVTLALLGTDHAKPHMGGVEVTPEFDAHERDVVCRHARIYWGIV